MTSNIQKRIATAYVDGSFNRLTGVYGSGVVFIHDTGEMEQLSFSGNDVSVSAMYQIGGEVNAAKEAITKAVNEGYGVIHIVYDYFGIEKWATGEWRAKKAFTVSYVNFISRMNKRIEILFSHVKSHSGNIYNDLADSLAKQACGMAEFNGDFLDDAQTDDCFVPPEGINKKCADSIRKFKRIEKKRFKDYAELKTFGKDAFSGLRIEKLKKNTPSEVVEKVSDVFDESKDLTNALRWYHRGLSADEAIRKVQVDLEIKENAEKSAKNNMKYAAFAQN